MTAPSADPLDAGAMDTRPALTRASELLRLNRPDQALVEASAVLARQPDSSEALRLVARCHTTLGNHHLAIEAARAAVAAQPDSEYGFRVLGRALTEAGEHRPAADAAETAVRLAPHEWRGHWLLGITRRHLDPDLAMSSAAKARDLAPEIADTHILCGLIHQRLGQPEPARAAYLRALQLDPENSAAHNNLAVLDGAARRWRHALRGFRTALRIDPQQSLARENLVGAIAYAVRLLAAVSTLCALVTTVLVGSAAGYSVPYCVFGCCLLTGLSGAAAWLARTARRESGPYGLRVLRTERRIVLAEAWFLCTLAGIGIVTIGQPSMIRQVTGGSGTTASPMLLAVIAVNLALYARRLPWRARRRGSRPSAPEPRGRGYRSGRRAEH